MKRTRPNMAVFMAGLTMILTIDLSGCVAGYAEESPEWDGQLYVGDVYDVGYRRGPFYPDRGHRPEVERSERGRESMGVRAHGSEHASPSHGHR